MAAGVPPAMGGMMDAASYIDRGLSERGVAASTAVRALEAAFRASASRGLPRDVELVPGDQVLYARLDTSGPLFPFRTLGTGVSHTIDAPAPLRVLLGLAFEAAAHELVPRVRYQHAVDHDRLELFRRWRVSGETHGAPDVIGLEQARERFGQETDEGDEILEAVDLVPYRRRVVSMLLTWWSRHASPAAGDVRTESAEDAAWVSFLEVGDGEIRGHPLRPRLRGRRVSLVNALDQLRSRPPGSTLVLWSPFDTGRLLETAPMSEPQSLVREAEDLWTPTTQAILAEDWRPHDVIDRDPAEVYTIELQAPSWQAPAWLLNGELPPRRPRFCRSCTIGTTAAAR